MAYLFHDEVKAQGRKNREERVLELLKSGYTIVQIAIIMGKSSGHIHGIRKRLIKDGKITKIERRR
jgi:DNA-binding NarL/FixJ family response regulator